MKRIFGNVRRGGFVLCALYEYLTFYVFSSVCCVFLFPNRIVEGKWKEHVIDYGEQQVVEDIENEKIHFICKCISV